MARGDETRLFLLAELARRGQAHGHELRREAQIGRTELWTDVHVGSIYSALRKMAAQGLSEELRSEREGRMPERTIYAITDEGRRELQVLIDAGLREIALPADPFDLAFSFVATPNEELVAVFDERIAALELRASGLDRQRAAAAQYLDGRDHLLFDHLAARIRTELEWHRNVRNQLAGGEDERIGPGPGVVPADRDR